MATATHDEVARLFPGIQDHTVLEILGTKASVDELEAALQLLMEDDEGLTEIKQRAGSRLNLLLRILADSEIQLQDEYEP